MSNFVIRWFYSHRFQLAIWWTDSLRRKHSQTCNIFCSNISYILAVRNSSCRKLTKELCDVIEDYSLVDFTTLDIQVISFSWLTSYLFLKCLWICSYLALFLQDKESVANLVRLIDKSNGYIFAGIDASAVEFSKIAVRDVDWDYYRYPFFLTFQILCLPLLMFVDMQHGIHKVLSGCLIMVQYRHLHLLSSAFEKFILLRSRLQAWWMSFRSCMIIMKTTYAHLHFPMSLISWTSWSDKLYKFCLTKQFTVAAVQEKYIKDDDNFDDDETWRWYGVPIVSKLLNFVRVCKLVIVCKISLSLLKEYLNVGPLLQAIY